jgi:hypothetical protein
MQFNPSIREHARSGFLSRRIRGASLAAGAALLCLGLTASPASAGGEFKDGFEDQLGRLLAVHAFQVGKVALLAGHVPGGYWDDSRVRYEGRRHRSEHAVHRDAPRRHDRRVERRHHGDRDRKWKRGKRRGHEVRRIEYHYHDSRRRPCTSLHEVYVHPDDSRHQRLRRDEERAYRRWLQHERRHH